MTTYQLYLAGLLYLMKWAAMTFVSKTYHELLDASGRHVCSVDQPDRILLLAASTLSQRCGVECTTLNGGGCHFYQFKSDSARCEMFRIKPEHFTVIDQCTAYSANVKGNVT